MVGNHTKTCSKCKRLLDISNFWKDKQKFDGYTSYCIDCKKKNYPIKPNKEKIKIWYQNNKENILKKQKEYRLLNPDKVKETNRRSIKKLRTNSDYKIKSNLRTRLGWLIRKKFNVSSSEILKYLGCSPLELKNYIELKFKDGMNWDNYGINGWHLDHIIPISIAKNLEDFYKLNHYTNLQPLWSTENRKKSNKYVV